MSNSQNLVTRNFSTIHDIVPWIGEKLHIGADFQQFSRNNIYVRVPGKLSEIHSKVPMFSNPGDKVLKCAKNKRTNLSRNLTRNQILSPRLENTRILE